MKWTFIDDKIPFISVSGQGEWGDITSKRAAYHTSFSPLFIKKNECNCGTSAECNKHFTTAKRALAVKGLQPTKLSGTPHHSHVQVVFSKQTAKLGVKRCPRSFS